MFFLTYILPEVASNWAPKLDYLFWLVTIICTFGFILVEGALIILVVKYRRKKNEEDKITPNITHNKILETIWTIIPSVLMMIVFYYGFIYFKDMRTFPENMYEINIVGKQWSWKAIYPNGVTRNTQSICDDSKYKSKFDCEKHHSKWTPGESIVFPLNKKIKLNMTSNDVVHSFYVPAFRVKQDVVPGIKSYLWFEATKEGVFSLYCTEYCGLDHSGMIGHVEVKQQAAFQQWLENIKNEQQASTNIELSAKELTELGANLFKKKACAACHNLEGIRLVGPPLNGLFGKEEKLDDGTTIKVDENYLTESLVDPNAKIVEGYPKGGMIAQDLTNQEVQALVEFLKACKTKKCQ